MAQISNLLRGHRTHQWEMDLDLGLSDSGHRLVKYSLHHAPLSSDIHIEGTWNVFAYLFFFHWSPYLQKSKPILFSNSSIIIFL